MQACGAVATSGFMGPGRGVESHNLKAHQDKRTCAVLMQHRLNLFQRNCSAVLLKCISFNNCHSSIAWECRAAGEEDTKERLGGRLGREGSLSVDHPDHAKSLMKRGRHGKQSN